jgi:uncharacterized protein (TIGR02453 family)
MNGEVFRFLSALEKNNDRDWFAANKRSYDESKNSFTAFIASVIMNVARFDPSIDIDRLEAKKTLFRIYRDTRFSMNKEPYKTNFGAIIVPEEYRRSWDYPGYYVHLQNDNSFVSMGVYMPQSAPLNRIRRAMDEDFDTFSGILKRLAPYFGDICRAEDSLRRVPAGFDKNSPAAEYLKLKNIYVYKSFTNAEVLSEDFLTTVSDLFLKSYELKCWLMEAASEQ